jgi:hypothetical protein
MSDLMDEIFFWIILLIQDHSSRKPKNLVKKKGKVKSQGLSTLRPHGPIVFLPQQVPAFISRGITHHTDAQDLYQRRRELLLMNFASKSGIYEIHKDLLHATKLGHGTYYFISPPKESILRIFRMPEKSNGFGRV